MIKTITFLTLFLLALTLTSAITIYAGESIEIELEKPFDYYSIVGNSTEVILDVVQNGNNVTITPDKYSQEDSYEIIFFDIEKEIITVYSGGGGGGGTRTIYEDKEVFVEVDNYIDREVEVLGETIEVEKVVIEYSWLFIIISLVLFLILLYLFITRNKVERRNEYKYE